MLRVAGSISKAAEPASAAMSATRALVIRIERASRSRTPSSVVAISTTGIATPKSSIAKSTLLWNPIAAHAPIAEAASGPSRQRRAATRMHQANPSPSKIAPGTPHSTIAWMYSFSRCENVMKALGSWTRVNVGSSAPRPIPSHGESSTSWSEERHASYLLSGWESSARDVLSS